MQMSALKPEITYALAVSNQLDESKSITHGALRRSHCASYGEMVAEEI